MAIRRKRPQPDEATFQMTPMIDMTFLLLIFFMVTTRMSKEKVKMDVKLPTASAAVMPDDLSNRDIINIDGAGAFYIANEQVTREALASYLKERFKNAPPLRIYLRADKAVAYGELMAVMQILRDGGFAQVALMAEEAAP